MRTANGYEGGVRGVKDGAADVIDSRAATTTAHWAVNLAKYPIVCLGQCEDQKKIPEFRPRKFGRYHSLPKQQRLKVDPSKGLGWYKYLSLTPRPRYAGCILARGSPSGPTTSRQNKSYIQQTAGEKWSNGHELDQWSLLMREGGRDHAGHEAQSK